MYVSELMVAVLSIIQGLIFGIGVVVTIDGYRVSSPYLMRKGVVCMVLTLIGMVILVISGLS